MLSVVTNHPMVSSFAAAMAGIVVYANLPMASGPPASLNYLAETQLETIDGGDKFKVDFYVE